MIEEKQRNIIKLAAMVFIIAVVAYALVSVFKPAQTETDGPTNEIAEPVPNTNPVLGEKQQLQDIVRLRRTWGPIMTAWHGEVAPDFALTDIDGKEHKLSNYRGKNVLLTFWATWCRPCISEIPSLITLQNMMGKDKLAILAISNEPAERVKYFAAARNLNYTVFSHSTLEMGRPYNQVIGIPTSFFIDPQGKIKIVTEGMVPFNDIRALLQAD